MNAPTSSAPTATATALGMTCEQYIDSCRSHNIPAVKLPNPGQVEILCIVDVESRDGRPAGHYITPWRGREPRALPTQTLDACVRCGWLTLGYDGYALTPLGRIVLAAALAVSKVDAIE